MSPFLPLSELIAEGQISWACFSIGCSIFAPIGAHIIARLIWLPLVRAEKVRPSAALLRGRAWRVFGRGAGMLGRYTWNMDQKARDSRGTPGRLDVGEGPE